MRRTKLAKKFTQWIACTTLAAALPLSLAAENLPSQLAGTWRITRILPVHNPAACWTTEQAQPLVGSTLTYSNTFMRWREGRVPLQDVTVHAITQDEFRQESSPDEGADFAQFGLHGSVTEVDLQHEDAYITGATTQVPGDTILLAGPHRIILSVCGVYYEARRGGYSTVSGSLRTGNGR